MPYDANTLTPALKRRLLIDDLRGDLAHWRWDFGSYGGCGTAGCAYARAVVLGLVDTKSLLPARDLAAALGIPAQDHFMFCSPSGTKITLYSFAEPRYKFPCGRQTVRSHGIRQNPLRLGVVKTTPVLPCVPGFVGRDGED